MNRYLIIGGGLAGLTAARLLKEHGVSFVGLEKEDRLGGRLETGHHRVYSDRSVQLLSRFCVTSAWVRIDEDARERKKGEWASLQEKVTPEESFYLKPSFYSTKKPFQELITELVTPIKQDFHVKKNVEKIDAENKKVTCQDGIVYGYEKLLWCSDLTILPKVWQGDNSALSKSLKKIESSRGGLNLDFEMKAPLFEFKNSIVFSFRFKEKKMRAIGVSETNTLHWMLFLDEDISEDREEVAKCVRTLKRELQKEFPKLKGTVSNEKIVFLPNLSGEPSAPIKTLEISKDVLYIGPQVSLETSDKELMNMDRTLENAIRFEEMLTPQ